MWSQNAVSALNQQTSQIRVASLGDTELRVAFTGLAAFRSKTKGSNRLLDCIGIDSYPRASGQT